MVKITSSGTISWDKTFSNLPNTFSYHCTLYLDQNQFYIMSITKYGGMNNDFNVMNIGASGTVNELVVLSTANTPANFEIDYITRMKYFNE